MTSNYRSSSARSLDKFYTDREVALRCVQRTLLEVGSLAENALFVEPSAGGGAFLDVLPTPRVGVDIDPPSHRSDITRADFLAWCPPSTDKPVIVIGNFPFGKNGALAVKFINHAASFADVVASILPRSFEKDSIQSRIDACLSLVHQSEVPHNSFSLDGRPYSVPVVFQVWRKCPEKRVVLPRSTSHGDFLFLPTAEGADFAFQRVGVRAGKVSREGLRRSPSSHYFVKVVNKYRPVFDILANIDWTDIKFQTAGNPSIGKADLVAKYQKATEQHK